MDSIVARSLLNVALISVTIADDAMIEASNDDCLLLDISMVDVTDGREICSLLDVVLVAITDVVEVSSLLVTTMVDITDSAKLSLPPGVTDSSVDCSLLKAVMTDATDISDSIAVNLLLDVKLKGVADGAVIEVSNK